MKSLNEILKSSGLNDATSPVGERVAPLEADPTEETDLCTRCGGAGFVRRTVRLGHPDFGKAFPCECTQDEKEDERLERLQRYSNLGPLTRLTFDNLIPRGRSPSSAHQESFSSAVEAARTFSEKPSGWLVLTGTSGCGKTHLAAAAAGRCIERGHAALFMVVPDLLDHLRAAYQPGSEVAYDELFDLVRNAPVLVLDDLGVQSQTSWADEKLFQLINHRYNAQLPTIFTTNLELAAFDQRLQTRLGDPTFAQVFTLEAGGGSGVSDLDSLGLPLLRAMTFKDFDARLLAVDADEMKNVQNAYRQAMNFAQEPKDWLVIAGSTGRGKTRLAAGIGNFCREAGTEVMFLVVPDLLDRLRSSYNPQSPTAFDRLFDQVREVPVLILDDLGAESGTPWADEKLFQLLNYRYNACLPTVITTNAMAGQIEDRVLTRLTDPAISSMLLMGRFDFWGKGEPKRAPSGRGSRSRR
ncbi:MAG: ATP-binding protein [Chloroflexi bacterium]|nr:ATP-binding protein [Chloroflexota bacterium]